MLYKRIKELRKEEKKTQADMGAVLGMSQRAYGHYENGDRDMSPEVLIALADYYDVSIDYLLGRTSGKQMKYERVKELRLELKLTQAQVGEILGVNQRTYSQYELGVRSISVDHLVSLADYYKVTLDYLVGRTNER